MKGSRNQSPNYSPWLRGDEQRQRQFLERSDQGGTKVTGWSASTDFPSADLPLDPPVTMPSLLSYGRRKLMIFDAQGVDEDLKVIDRRRFITYIT